MQANQSYSLTPELQELEKAFEELGEKLDSHDCTYEDGCPCFDWMLDKYELCLELRGLRKEEDDEADRAITLSKELQHEYDHGKYTQNFPITR